MRPSLAERFFNRPFAAKTLLALAKDEPMTAGQFQEASGYADDESAKLLRDDLDAWGLVVVEPAIVNGKPGQRVTLTTAGRRVAELTREIGKPAHRLRALKTLLALAQDGPMTTREFVEASRYIPSNAKLLREDLEKWGLVTVEEGNVNGRLGHRIALTPAGSRVAELSAEVWRILEKAAKQD